MAWSEDWTIDIVEQNYRAIGIIDPEDVEQLILAAKELRDIYLRKRALWDQAPEGAQFFGPADSVWFASWYKKVDDQWYFILHGNDATHWGEEDAMDDDRILQLECRPN